MFERSSGILLHPTSLPGKYGIGSLGKEAYKFVDFLKKANQKLWQIFPLGPTGYGDSPYQCFSTFAGNPYLIDFDLLIEQNLLTEEDLRDVDFGGNEEYIDYGAIYNQKYPLLRKAYENFKANENKELKKERLSEDSIRFINKIAKLLDCSADKLISNIYKITNEEFNIDSSQQLGEILFEKMQIPVVKKTKTRYSTDVEVLEKIAKNEELSDEKREIAKNLLEYRAFKKLLSTYIEPIPQYADKDSRIHTTFNQNGTATGRLSSANPNLQNIPVRTDDGIRIRTGFVAKDGYNLISFDYSQIELRVLAELSKDKNLIRAYQEDKDLHELTARKIFFKNEDEEISRNERSIAKVINFSILYGKTNFGLSKELNISVGDAAQYIKTYFEEYPRVRKFLDIVTETAKLHSFVETFYGTRRYIKGIDSENKNILSQAVRMAVNTVVQGTAANIIKIVMIKLYEELKNDENIKMLLQVHDELIFEVKNGFEETYMKKIKDIMENTVKFEKVPLKANGNIAKNWGLLK